MAAPYTRFGLDAYGVRRAGSFAGKPAFSFGPHPVGVITRFGMDAYGVRRAGSFAGKTPFNPPPDTGSLHNKPFIANVGTLMGW